MLNKLLLNLKSHFKVLEVYYYLYKKCLESNLQTIDNAITAKSAPSILRREEATLDLAHGLIKFFDCVLLWKK